MTKEDAFNNIVQALNSNSFTAPKAIHMALEESLQVIKQVITLGSIPEVFGGEEKPSKGSES